MCTVEADNVVFGLVWVLARFVGESEEPEPVSAVLDLVELCTVEAAIEVLGAFLLDDPALDDSPGLESESFESCALLLESDGPSLSELPMSAR